MVKCLSLSLESIGYDLCWYTNLTDDSEVPVYVGHEKTFPELYSNALLYALLFCTNQLVYISTRVRCRTFADLGGSTILNTTNSTFLTATITEMMYLLVVTLTPRKELWLQWDIEAGSLINIFAYIILVYETVSF